MDSILFLVAGRGKRLGEITANVPKPLVKINKSSILEIMLNKLSLKGFNNFFLVTGYLRQKFREIIGNNYKGIKLNYIPNTDWNKANNIYSLWKGKNVLLKDDTLIIEGDAIIEKSILTEIINCEYDNFIVVSPWKKGMQGAKLKADKNNNVTDWYIERNPNSTVGNDYFKSVSIFKGSKKFNKKYLVPTLNKLVKNLHKNGSMYYDEVLSALAKKNPGLIKALNIGKAKWIEIDTKEDLNKARKIFKNE